MDVVALQEIRWKGKGSIRNLKFSLHYSGNEDREGNRGVGIIASKKASRSLLGFSPIYERKCTLLIKGKFHNIAFVNAYALTEDTEDEIVGEFYETLQSVCDELPKHDAIITLGDLMPHSARNKYTKISLEDIACMKSHTTMNLD